MLWVETAWMCPKSPSLEAVSSVCWWEMCGTFRRWGLGGRSSGYWERPHRAQGSLSFSVGPCFKMLQRGTANGDSFSDSTCNIQTFSLFFKIQVLFFVLIPNVMKNKKRNAQPHLSFLLNISESAPCWYYVNFGLDS